MADTYDAMTTDRPYRRALPVDITREELLRGAGVQWDARCVEAFVELIDLGEVLPPPATDDDVLTASFGRRV